MQIPMKKKEEPSIPDSAGVYLAHALIALMEKKPLEEISVTELTKKAGVSRMSYYRSFSSKQQILEEYLNLIICRYRSEVEKKSRDHAHSGYLHLLQSFRFFRQYRHFVLCLDQADLSSILLDGLNRYLETYILPPQSDFLNRCNGYYYAGALCNVYLLWLKEGMPETEETMAALVLRLTKIPKR